VLTGLHIRNFKAWRDTGPVELAPLTVLFGSNSSGKSSLLQLPLMLRQTVAAPDRRRVLHAGDASTPVSLGAFGDYVFDHDLDRALGFEIDWNRRHDLKLVDARNERAYSGRSLSFSVEIAAGGQRPPQLHVERFEYALRGDEDLRLGMARRPDGDYDVTADNYEPVRFPGRPWPIGDPPANFHGFPDQVNHRYQNLEVAADLVFEFERALDGISYLGPLRQRPDRLYRWSGDAPPHVGWQGERTVDALLAGAGRRYNTKKKHKTKSLQELVASELKALKVIDRFVVETIGEGRDEYEVRVRAAGGGEDVLLTDVGFGVSQVLPVVAQCFYAPPGSTILLEQPEMHLHPGVQAGLADLFLRALTMREGNDPRDIQLIIESHSEHFLRRLLLRIAEGEIDRDEVRLYFVSSRRGSSRLEQLDIDESGNVLNWPSDFFGDQMTDIARQARIAAERRLSAAR
jgi:predicted ATPase